MAATKSGLLTFSRCCGRTSTLLLWLALLTCVNAQNQNRKYEVEALANFRAGTEVTEQTGSSHSALAPRGYWSSWNKTDRNPCAWVGVTCTANYTVGQLDLSGWGLNKLDQLGSLADLRELHQLDLSSNDLSDATIPDDVGTLTGLTRLDLSRNNFGGNIPSNISGCRNLRYLSLEQNQLEGDIPNLSALVNLQVLSLANNQLTGPFPKDLGQITSLVSLDLSGNMLTGSIPSLANLTVLLDLNLDSNNFTQFEVPESPGAKSLKHLFVSGNQLKGAIPRGMINLLHLEVLNMSNNRLSGEIPSGLARQINHSFWLDLSQNQLTGQIPSDLLEPSPPYTVASLNLSHNHLTGNIPMPLDGPEGRLFFDVLDLSYNHLSGPIPFLNNNGTTEIYSLWLQNNSLSGDIVDLFAYGEGFGYSYELRLESNLFTGDLSRIVGNWSGLYFLKVLDLSNNNLRMSTTTGMPDPMRATLESFMGGNLREFRIGGNNFSGTSLPAAYVSGTNEVLEVLDLSNSHLHGEISGSAFNSTWLPALNYLNFSNNNLSGTISENTVLLPNLAVLDVSNNNLSGALPALPRNSSLRYDPSLFEGNALCGEPLASCPSNSTEIWIRTKGGIPLWALLMLVGGSVLVAVGSCMVATWRWRVYRKRHQQDADLIKTLMERDSATLMSLRELRKATDNFADSAQIGEGGFGTVYVGTLTDGTMVAIKRSKREGSENDKEQFLNEVRILSQVNHRNLVKLLGCCMANNVKLLVFEFVSNGTLLEHLQGKIGGGRRLSWKQRLNIAVQTADALNYLHSAATFPIYHRDVKSANILLNGELNAKVADFGISKLAPVEATHVSTAAVQGTMGYIDPEYYTSYQLTSKSDVYSFGVVLLELISAKPALDFRRGGDQTSLVNFAHSFLERGNLDQFVDPALAEAYSEPRGRDSMLSVGRLAMQCLEMRSKARPSMYEVGSELQTVWLDLVGSSKQLGSVQDCNYFSEPDDIVLLSESSTFDNSSSKSQNENSAIQLSRFSPR